MAQRDYEIQLAAGQTENIRATGDFVYLKFAKQPINVIIDQADTQMVEGDKRRITGGFQEIRVQNLGDFPTAAIFTIGDGDFDRIIVQGELSVNNQIRRADGRLYSDRRRWYDIVLDLRTDQQAVPDSQAEDVIKSPFTFVGPGAAFDGRRILFEAYNPDTLLVYDAWSLNQVKSVESAEVYNGNPYLSSMQPVWSGGGGFVVGFGCDQDDLPGPVLLSSQGDFIADYRSDAFRTSESSSTDGIEKWAHDPIDNVLVGIDGQRKDYAVLTMAGETVERGSIPEGLSFSALDAIVFDQRGESFLYSPDDHNVYKLGWRDRSFSKDLLVDTNDDIGFGGDGLSLYYIGDEAYLLHGAQSSSDGVQRGVLNADGATITAGTAAAANCMDPFQVLDPAGVTFADITLSGGRLSGAVVKAAIELQTGIQAAPDDYLDFVYGVRWIEPDGTPKAKVSGDRSFTAAGISDSFDIPARARVGVHIDTALFD